MVSFRPTKKNNEIIAEKPFPNTGVTNAHVAFSARHKT